ncbi:hypothetical protein CRUP_036162, partial [Coryphaenoides rupestris]
MDEVSQPLPRHREGSGAAAAGVAAGGGTRPKSLLDYNVYMAKYVSPWAQAESATAAPAHSPESSPPATKRKYWANMVSKKIQMKLSKIRLPYFMNELTLTELDMGFAIPKILQASRSSVDHQ